MKILLDSNFIIRIVDVRTPMPLVYAELVRLANLQHHDLCYHPGSRADIESDPEDERRNITLSRLEQYQILEAPPMPDDRVLRRFGWSSGSRNNEVDNALLYAVLRGAVDVLVTEDVKMHHKARRAGISDVVLHVEELVSRLRSAETKKGRLPVEFLKIESRRLQDIDLLDPIFDSLRISYPEFDRWYRASAASGRCAWVVYGDGSAIRAICIFKEELDPIIGSDGMMLSGKVLKLCTFKVAGRGDKLGERLLDYAFHFAADQGFRAVYMQIRKGGDAALIRLVDAFGFVSTVAYKNDISYVKQMGPGDSEKGFADPEDNLRFAIARFPYFIGDANVRKFIVPIRPTFHDLLFPETISQDMLFAQDGQSFPSETNAICKAYVCRSRITLIRPGDLLFFYRSRFGKFIECVGVVETVKHSSSVDFVLKTIARRTVFSDNQIRRIVANKTVLVMRFRLLCYLKEPVRLRELEACGVQGNYQSIRTLPEGVYEKLFHPRLKYAVPGGGNSKRDGICN